MRDWMVLMAVLVVPQEGPVSTEIRQPVRVNTERACRDTAAKNTLQREEIRNGYKVVISIKAQCIYDPESVASVPAGSSLAESGPIPPREIGPGSQDRELAPEPEEREWYDPRGYIPFRRN